MEHRNLTDASISAYLALFEEASHREATAFAAYSVNDRVMSDGNSRCYASLPGCLHVGDDHCGVLYNGYNYPSIIQWAEIRNIPRTNQSKVVKAYGFGAREWLNYLLSAPAFKDIVCHLRFSDADTIMKHKGFIFHELGACPNLDLLWMFISMARCPSENPRSLAHWMYLRTQKYDPHMIAYIAMTMQPMDYCTTLHTAVWSRQFWNHGNPFGCSRERFFGEYIKGKPKINRTSGMTSMSMCQTIFYEKNMPITSGSLESIITQMRGKDEVPAAA